MGCGGAPVRESNRAYENEVPCSNPMVHLRQGCYGPTLKVIAPVVYSPKNPLTRFRAFVNDQMNTYTHTQLSLLKMGMGSGGKENGEGGGCTVHCVVKVHIINTSTMGILVLSQIHYRCLPFSISHI